MRLKTKYRIAITVIAMLCIGCVALGAALYQTQKTTGDKAATVDKPAKQDQATVEKNFDAFFNNLDQQFLAERQQSFQLLDNFFNDDFFNNTEEPFKAMEKIHQEMLNRMGKNLKGTFDNSWDAWFKNRFSDTGLLPGSAMLNEQTEETKDAYIYHFTTPDLNGQKLNVKIDEQGITIQGDYTQQAKKTNDKDKVIARQESRSSVYERFSIPEGVDLDKAKISNKGNEITVRLPKKPVS
jgi:HSP20 family molecular chaperone IbpA